MILRPARLKAERQGQESREFKLGSLNKIRKAVVPAAGLGTRWLPIAKTVPKEMMPLLQKPVIQYVVEEAVSSGLDSVIVVTSEGKSALEDYFQPDPALERLLEESGKGAEAEGVRQVSRLAKFCFVRQQRPLGLADAIRCARSLVGSEPFAVLLPDNIFDCPSPCLRQLIDWYEKRPGCILATRVVEPAEVSTCGILDVEPLTGVDGEGKFFRVRGLVEKPRPEEALSRYAIAGRYILEPEIFDCIDQTRADAHGEIQLTDALLLYSRAKRVYAYCFQGREHNVGDSLGFLQATVEYSLKDPVLRERFRNYLASLKLAD